MDNKFKVSTTASRLNQVMTEQNLRQVDLLKKAEPFCQQYGIKLTKTDLSQYLSGKVLPGQHKLTILSFALNVSPVWLMGYNVAKPAKAPTICNHKSISEFSYFLSTINDLCEDLGYEFLITANSVKIHHNDLYVTLSPEQLEDYYHNILDGISSTTLNLFTSRLKCDDIPIVNAAHSLSEASVEAIEADNKIMDDDNF